MNYVFVEPCCGSASIALHFLGARRSLMTYQGSKWRYRHTLIDVFQTLGFSSPPTSIEVTDSGPWGAVIETVTNPKSRSALIRQLRLMSDQDPRSVFNELQRHDVPIEPLEFAAQFLFLQRLSFSGKAVGIKDGLWMSPGFNKSSAYGIPATAKFGAISPMIPSLVRVLTLYNTQLSSVPVRSDMRAATAPKEIKERTLVYIDPPYAGTTSYPNGDMNRREVVDLARAWASTGASVVVSEGVPIKALQDRGWSTLNLAEKRFGGSSFRGNQEEWITLKR